MLTGDLRISNGEAFVRGIRLKTNMMRVRKMIGYCPQFDALFDDLTGSQALDIFALLRGVRYSNISKLKECLAKQLTFEKHMNKKIGEYSGGNKRKLSSALALIGNPAVIYLGVCANSKFYNLLMRAHTQNERSVSLLYFR